MTKHTAGPWISDGETIDLFDFELENRRFWISADGMVIGYVDGFGNKDNEERKANARLIAAAPELLAELITMTDAYSKAMKDAGVSSYPEALVIVRSARAAIAKASGETNE